MPKLSERGVIQFMVLLILVIGLVAGVYLVQQTQIFKPKASVSGPITPQTSFTLKPAKQDYLLGEEVVVQLLVRSDIDAANLFQAAVEYNYVWLKLARVDTTSSFIKNWVEQSWQDPGKISLIGAVPDPGFQTRMGENSAVMATLHFIAQKTGQLSIVFGDSSAIHRNLDNLDILVIKNNASITIKHGTSPVSAPITTPSPTPLPTPTPTPTGRFVTITFPNGGETLTTGQTYRIRWNSNRIDQVMLGYSFGPGSLNHITSSPIVNTGYYDWVGNIGNTTNNKVKINVLGYETGVGQASDQSDDFFTVLPTSSFCNGIGDVNQDGSITATDSLRVLRIVAGLVTPTAEQTRRADVTGDGKITATDALQIQRYIAGLIKTFPVCPK